MIQSSLSNDSIDIYGEAQVKLKTLPPTNERELRIELRGKSIDNSVVNALRRTIMMYIPVYAFHRSDIHVNSKNSYNMYNDDLIKNQIETLPIFDIENRLDLVDPETYLSKALNDKLFGNFTQTRTSQESDQSTTMPHKYTKIDLLIDYKNNTDTDHFLSTHDVTLKVNEKIVSSYQKRDPICILVLKPGESLVLKAEASLGISHIHAVYEATTNVVHEELSSTHYRFWYETLEQLPKELIFSKACMYLYKKLESLRTFISETYTTEEQKVEIQLFGEEHTLGNLIATVLQKCEHVRAAGYYVPHPFIDNIIISYQLESDSTKKTIPVLIDCIDYLIGLFRKIYQLSVN